MTLDERIEKATAAVCGAVGVRPDDAAMASGWSGTAGSGLTVHQTFAQKYRGSAVNILRVACPELFDGKHKIVPVEPTKDKSSEGFAGLPERYQPTTKASP